MAKNFSDSEVKKYPCPQTYRIMPPIDAKLRDNIGPTIKLKYSLKV